MSAEVIVGLLTLLGIMYMAWLQTEQRTTQVRWQEAEVVESSTGALSQLVESLLSSIETLASRESLIAELRGRIETLERNDRLKSAKIGELEFKVSQLEQERVRLLSERDRLTEQLLGLQPLAERSETVEKA